MIRESQTRRPNSLVKCAPLLIALFILSGCSYTYTKSQYHPLSLTPISVGMDKADVQEAIGPPGDVIGSQLYEDGTVVEVLHYYEAKLGVHYDTINKEYYLYFVDDELVQWGPPGAWKREADRIYEIRNR